MVSRTLHECVDWNSRRINSRCGAKCRTLHECVDWNIHSGLTQSITSVALFTSAWIETDIRENIQFWDRQSHSSRVRGLKLIYVLEQRILDWSHSSRVRGLKQMVILCRSALYLVALFTSAWIETRQQRLSSRRLSCRTLHECVDWNINFWKSFTCRYRRTLHECVDWNW